MKVYSCVHWRNDWKHSLCHTNTHIQDPSSGALVATQVFYPCQKVIAQYYYLN